MVSVIKQGFCGKVQPCKTRNTHSFGDYYHTWRHVSYWRNIYCSYPLCFGEWMNQLSYSVCLDCRYKYIYKTAQSVLYSRASSVSLPCLWKESIWVLLLFPPYLFSLYSFLFSILSVNLSLKSQGVCSVNVQLHVLLLN